MIRAVALSVLVALVPGAATADQSVWSISAPSSEIVADPWTDIGVSPLFDVDDAYVFADVPRAVALDDDATAAAVKIDQDRMAAAPGSFQAIGRGRIGDAFEGFVAVGDGELAYASVGMTRSGGSASVRLAGSGEPAPHASLVAALLARR